MSCERASQKIGHTGAISSGIARLNNTIGHVMGGMASRLDRATAQVDRTIETVGQKAAPLTAMAVNVIKPKDRHTRQAVGAMIGVTAATAVVLAAAGAGDGRQVKRGVRAIAAGGQMALRALAPQAYMALKLVQATHRLTGALGSGVGALSKTGPVGEVMQEKRRLLFFKKQVPVSLWTSSLTPWLNRRDVIGAVGAKNIVSSRGLMFTTGGQTWHQGTTVVKLPAGKRTLTHLQSLSLPASHYFFNRSISKEQAVGLASGRLEPLGLPGFVGQVSAVESLCPAWAQSKQLLLKAHLHWPPGET
ncbi:MAG TPA: hypothetical protein VGD99_13600 [Anaerolineae bacterium]